MKTSIKRNFKIYLVLLLTSFLFTNEIKAQLIDSFLDGDLTNNPSWILDSSEFNEIKSELRSNLDIAGTADVYVKHNQTNIETWNFKVRMLFNPSSANYIDVFLLSDTAPNKSVNGLFIRLGNTLDEISLYQRLNSINTEVISGVDKVLNTSSNILDIKVEKIQDTFKLYRKLDGSASFYLEGLWINASPLNLPYFGIRLIQSASNKYLHFFDNIYIGKKPIDIAVPKIASIKVVDSFINVFWNEPVQIPNIVDFSLNGYSILQVTHNSDFTTLKFDKSLINNTNLTLFYKGIKDLVNNMVVKDSFNFINVKIEIPTIYDLVITEIMSNPTPPINGLPDFEYIEIWNRSNKWFSLDSFTFGDATSEVKLPNIIIKPAQRWILSSSTSNFSSFGNWVGIPNFPSLNNDGDDLFLKYKNQSIFEITYQNSWHSTALKKIGGWALEMADSTLFCVGNGNWFSNTTIGGTPGKTNSLQLSKVVIPKTKVSNYFILDSIITMDLNQSLGNCLNCKCYINKVLKPVTIIKNQIIANIGYAPIPNSILTIELQDFTTCFGAKVELDSFRVGVKSNNAPFVKDILINELLFDPVETNEDYVELINISNQVFDLSEFFIANTSDNGVINDAYRISDFPKMLLPNQYICLTENESAIENWYPLYKNVFQCNTLPTYSNDKGTAALVYKNNDEIHRFNYTDDLHFDLLANKDGVSLERINTDTFSENWVSAAANNKYGTPGFINSQFGKTPVLKSFATLASKIVTPNMDGVEDVLRIFIENIEPNTLANVVILDEWGRDLGNVLENVLVSNSDILIWDGTIKSKQMPIGNYIAYVYTISASGKKKQSRLVFSILGNF